MYRPVAFWFLNHFLEESELERQLRTMAEQGFGGVMLHARDGMRTDYLSADFARCLSHVIRVAKVLNLEVWLYDEFHYPSGAAGFRMNLTPEESMQTLKVVEERVAASGEEVTPAGELAYAVNPDSGETLALAPGVPWRVPDAWPEAKLFMLAQMSWEANPVSVFDRFPDYTDPDLTERFIGLTHRWYFEHFGADFGKTIRGIFSDNTCGNFAAVRRSIPWGRDFAERFRAYTGEGIEAHLPRLLDASLPDSVRSRLLFWDFFQHAYLDSYFTPIGEYCREAGIHSTGHLACEDGLGEHVRQIGDYFEVMRHFSYCAVDDLGPLQIGDSLTRRSDDAGWLPQKLTASCARFLGRDEVMCECLGLAGECWKLTLHEVRRITGWLAVAGVNVFVPHGIYYSIAGHRKWECTPDHLHTPAWRYYRHWTDWIARISEASTGGANCAEVALLYPVETLKATVELGVKAVSGDRGDAAMAVEDCFRDTVHRLFAGHVDFEIIDEVLLGRSRIEADGTLTVPSEKPEFDQRVRVLLLPSCRLLKRSSWEKLTQWCEAGGRVIVLDQAPDTVIESGCRIVAEASSWPQWRREESGWLAQLPRTRHITNPELASRMWTKDGKTWVLVFNPAMTEQETEITFADGLEFDRIDADTGTRFRWHAGRRRLASAEALLLVEREAAYCPEPPATPARELKLPKSWQLTTLQPNVLPLRQWRTEADGKWQRHCFEFDIDARPPALTLVLDLEMSRNELAAGGFGARVECRVNGKKVPAFHPGSYLDRYMSEAEIGALLVLGGNRIEIICDSLQHEWERRLHPVLLAGRFRLRHGCIGWEEAATPVRLGRWREDGFPFFAGTAEYRSRMVLPPGASLLRIPGDGHVVELCVNGHSLGVRSGEPYAFAVTGTGEEAEITVSFTNTNSSLLE